MVIKMKTISLVLIISAVFLVGALAGKFTGWPIASIYSSAGDLNANTLTVNTVKSSLGIVNFNSSIRGYKTIMGVASGRDIAISGSSLGGRGLFGRSETGYGVEGYANTATGYSGFFHGGKGLYTDKISFGTGAFTSGNGRLVLAAESGMQCGNVCLTHGLGCIKTLAIEGSSTAMTMRDVLACGYSTGLKFCLCG